MIKEWDGQKLLEHVRLSDDRPDSDLSDFENGSSKRKKTKKSRTSPTVIPTEVRNSFYPLFNQENEDDDMSVDSNESGKKSQEIEALQVSSPKAVNSQKTVNSPKKRSGKIQLKKKCWKRPTLSLLF